MRRPRVRARATVYLPPVAGFRPPVPVAMRTATAIICLCCVAFALIARPTGTCVQARVRNYFSQGDKRSKQKKCTPPRVCAYCRCVAKCVIADHHTSSVSHDNLQYSYINVYNKCRILRKFIIKSTSKTEKRINRDVEIRALV